MGPSFDTYISTLSDIEFLIALALSYNDVAVAPKRDPRPNPSTQKEAIESLRKFNLLAFKKNADNEAEYEIEKKRVREILKGDDFVELMKINSQYGKGVIKYLGEEDAIDEVIIYGDSKDKGFALVRVLGKDMNPAHIVQLMQAIQKSDFKGEGLGEIGQFLKG